MVCKPCRRWGDSANRALPPREKVRPALRQGDLGGGPASIPRCRVSPADPAGSRQSDRLRCQEQSRVLPENGEVGPRGQLDWLTEGRPSP